MNKINVVRYFVIWLKSDYSRIEMNLAEMLKVEDEVS